MAETPPPPKLVKEIPAQAMVFAVAWVPGGRRLVYGGAEFKVYEVDAGAEKPEPYALGAHESYVTGVAVSGNVAISGGYDGRLIWWDLDARSQIRSVDAHTKWIRKVALSPDGKTLASVGDDMACRLWDVATGEKRAEFQGHDPFTPTHFTSMLHACAFAPDGRHVATGDKVGRIVVWDVESGTEAARLEAPGLYTWDPTQRRHSIGGIRSLGFSPDGRKLAAGGIGKVGNIDGLEAAPRVDVFDWRERKSIYETPKDLGKGIVERLLFLDDHRILAVGGANDGFSLRIELGDKPAAHQEKLPSHAYDAAIGGTPSSLAVGGNGKVGVYEVSG